jgi:hypothetical protein
MATKKNIAVIIEKTGTGFSAYAEDSILHDYPSRLILNSSFSIIKS